MTREVMDTVIELLKGTFFIIAVLIAVYYFCLISVKKDEKIMREGRPI